MPAAQTENPRGFRLLMLLYIPAADCASSSGRSGFRGRPSAIGFCRRWYFRWASPPAFSACWRRMKRCIAAIRSRRFSAMRMLTGMSYRHFRIAHIHGHHRWAGTEQDSATARLGEGFYHFLLRTVAGQFAEAWRFERQRRGLRVASRDLARDGWRCSPRSHFFAGPRALAVLPSARARWRCSCWSFSITSPITA